MKEQRGMKDARFGAGHPQSWFLDGETRYLAASSMAKTVGLAARERMP
jgi:hypothetical protein